MPEIWRTCFFAICVFWGTGSYATTHTDTLYLNNGTQIYFETPYRYLAFNKDSADTIRNHALQFDAEILLLTIFNRDSVPHSIAIDGFELPTEPIEPMGSATFEIDFTDFEGTFRLYASSARGALLGASTIVLKGHADNDAHYFWNLFDQESGVDSLVLTDAIDAIPIGGYLPSVFTINGNYYPFSDEDATVQVQNQVGESIVIAIVNSGKMSHALHFHGYHVTILDATKDAYRAGWIKDTFNLLPGEGMTVLLVPHQPGMYPVHNHNLISVNTGGYPGGMMTMLEIVP